MTLIANECGHPIIDKKSPTAWRCHDCGEDFFPSSFLYVIAEYSSDIAVRMIHKLNDLPPGEDQPPDKGSPFLGDTS